jgi:5-hydroxyisourate hydrolase-like protein (transthyretin family)
MIRVSWAVLLLTAATSLGSLDVARASAHAAEPVIVSLNGPDRSVVTGRPTDLLAHVLDSVTGLPQEGRAVQLSVGGLEVAAGTTDEDGSVLFTVEALDTAEYTATAEGQASNALTITPRRNAPPGPVDRPRLFPGNQSVRVTWARPYDDGSGIGYYEVRLWSFGPENHRFQQEVLGHEAVFTGLTNGVKYSVLIFPHTPGGGVAARPDRHFAAGTATPTAEPPELPAGEVGTDVCGTLARGVTRWTASDGPYRICPAGAFLPRNGKLVLDGSDGGFSVVGDNHLVIRGAVRTEGTDAARPVVFDRVSLALGFTPVVHGEYGQIYRAERDPASARLSHVQLRRARIGGYGTHLRVADITVDGPEAEHVLDREYRWFHSYTEELYPPGIEFVGPSVHATRVQLQDHQGTAARFVASVAVGLTHVQIARAGGTGLVVRAPMISGHSVDVSASAHEVYTWEGLGQFSYRRGPAAELSSRSHFSPGSLTQVSGSGNGIDATALLGSTNGDVTWQPISRTSPGQPMGWLSRDLTIGAGTTLTVPSKVTFVGAARLRVQGTLLAREGSLFTGATSTRSELPCPSVLADLCLGVDGVPPPPAWCENEHRFCPPNDLSWGGILVEGGRLEATGAVIEQAVTAIDVLDGSASVTGSMILRSRDAGIRAAGAGGVIAVRSSLVQFVSKGTGIEIRGRPALVDRTYISDTSGPGLVVDNDDANISVSNTSVFGAGHPGIRLATTGDLRARSLVIRRTRGLAAEISGAGFGYGSGLEVDGLTGSQNGTDAVSLSGARNAVPYGQPTSTSADRALTPIRPAHVPRQGSASLLQDTVVCQPRDGRINIGFGALGDATPTAYQVAVSGRPVATLTPSAPRVITGLKNGTTYAIHVRALKGAESSPWSSYPCLATPRPPLHPAVITGLSVKPVLGGVVARWKIGSTAWVSAIMTPSIASSWSSPPGEASFKGMTPSRTYKLTLTPIDSDDQRGKPIIVTLRGTSIAATSPSITRGQTTSLTVNLRDQATGSAIANQVLQVSARPTGAAEWAPVARVTTAANGRAVLKVRPNTTTQYRFDWAGTPGRMAARATGTVHVR